MENSNPISPKTEKKSSWRHPAIQRMCFVGVFTALMCVLSPLSIPIEPISITMATLVLYFIGALLDWKWSSLVVLLYLLLGSVGLPVFSKFQGGFQVILGPSGGFLIGYLPCVVVESLLIGFFKDKKWMYPIAMIVGTIVLYAIGVLWFMLYLGNGFGKAMAACVIPFLPGDAFKIAVASIFSLRIRPLFEKKR